MRLQEKLTKALEERKALVASITNAETREALDKIELEIRKKDIEIQGLKDAIEEEQHSNPENDPEARKAGAAPQGGLNPMATFNTAPQQRSEADDVYSTLEYRNAFKDYIMNGTPIPSQFIQKRSDQLTTVSDIGAVIPTTIQQKVIEDITVEGKILARITQTAFQGGIQIPISDINLTATWLESESVVSDEQKAEMNAKLTFSYHVLEAKVAIGLLSSTVSLPVFESTVVNQLKKAMTKALETAIVNGTGSGQPLGFTKYSLPSNQVIEMTSATIGTVGAWASVEAAIPEAYEDGVIYVMAKSTWEKYLNGMTDTTGQKIGLGKINEKGQKILNGREVLTVDKLPSFDSASNGDIFAAVVDLSQYCLNSNLAMYYKKYFNEDKNKWIHKALMIADGKMAIGKTGTGSTEKLVGAKGLIYIKKDVTE